jgi:hypothetical protein
MAVSITNIVDLLAQEKAGTPPTWNNQGSETQTDCHNYKLAGASTCGTLADQDLYLDIEAFEPIAYKETKKVTELIPGKDLTTYRLIDPIITFTVYGDETLHNQLQIIAAHQTIVFTNIEEALEESVYTMEVTATPSDVLLEIKVTLSFTDAQQVTKLCCGSYYENAPFNECDGEGETGEPNNDPDCADYNVSIALTTGPDTLTASSVGGGAGVETFQWYKDGVAFGTGASINPVLSGVYRVDSVKGNCTDTASYTYSIGCEGYEVTILTLTQADGTVVYVAQANMVSTYQWQEEIAMVWTDVLGETDIAFEPAASGTFRVVATAGSCTANSTEEVYTAPDTCDGVFTITLENDGGTLTVTIVDYVGVDTPAYEWYLDTGTGLTLLPSETSATLADATPGYYTVVVTIGGCVQTAGLLIQCDFAVIGGGDCVDDSAWSQSFAGDDVSVAFNVTNFYLVDPLYVSAVEIAATYLVQKNGVTLQYSASPADGTTYTIDYTNQEIELNAGFPLLTGETLTIVKLKSVQL